MVKFEFTKEEVTALLQLIDLAVKHAGMQAAEAAVVLTKKLQNPITDINDANI